MNPEREILEKWIEKLAASHAQNAAALCAPRPDPFRNPVAYAIRKSLAELWEQLQGDMDPGAIDSALDTVLRIRAVQDLSPSHAVGFVTQLRSILRQAPATFDLALLENRIDQLTLAAFDKYMQCRDQLRAARLHETERLTHRHRVAGKAGA
jgi:hypothetical protein